jgi:hypothetical protein
MQFAMTLGHIGFVETSPIDGSAGVNEADFDRHGVIGEHEASGGAGDAEDLRDATIAEP